MFMKYECFFFANAKREKGKNNAFTNRKIELSYCHGEETNFKENFTFEFMHFPFRGKLLNFFQCSIRSSYTVLHFCHLKIFGKKVILRKFLICRQNLSSTFLKKVLMKKRLFLEKSYKSIRNNIH